MRTSQLVIGEYALWTPSPAGPFNANPVHTGVKVRIVAVGVRHEYEAVGDFSGRNGGSRSVNNGVLVERVTAPLSGKRFTCRTQQLWSWQEWGERWEREEVRREAERAREAERQDILCHLAKRLGLRLNTRSPGRAVVTAVLTRDDDSADMVLVPLSLLTDLAALRPLRRDNNSEVAQ